MNKLLKGSIAGAAGIALLLGGAGTLAYWNSSATLASATVNSGTLAITAGTATTFYEGTTSVPTRIVPGDTVVVTQNVTIAASGDNLTAALTIDETQLAGGADLIDQVDISFAAFAGSTPVTNLGSLSATQAASITSVVVTVEFENDGTVDNSAKNQTLQLGSLNILLTQVV